MKNQRNFAEHHKYKVIYDEFSQKKEVNYE